MILKEYAKQNNITLKEAKSRTGLTHWKQTVPESCDEIAIVDEGVELEECDKLSVEELFETLKVGKTIQSNEVIQVIEEAIVSHEAKKRSVNGLGTKSPYWAELRGRSDNG